MPESTTPEEVARWDRWFAIEMNGRAWTLSEKPDRTAAEGEEMLDAAHAAAAHWARIGNDLNKARADMLLGQVHALLGHGPLAIHYAGRGHAYITSRESPDWEVAFAHAILASAARASGDRELYESEYALAKSSRETIADEEDKAIFDATFLLLPPP